MILLILSLALTAIISIGVVNAMIQPMADYYTSGLDIYRLATNETIGDVLSPAKTFIRSETVDFQAGEVEWKGGNLFYDKWDSNLKVNSYDKCNQ